MQKSASLLFDIVQSLAGFVWDGALLLSCFKDFFFPFSFNSVGGGANPKRIQSTLPRLITIYLQMELHAQK